MAIIFEYDEEGNLIAYENGEKVGEIVTMGDEIMKKREDN